jgi:sulfur relay (sulfurtransferase) DsrF/TusC family protein
LALVLAPEFFIRDGVVALVSHYLTNQLIPRCQSKTNFALVPRISAGTNSSNFKERNIQQTVCLMSMFPFDELIVLAVLNLVNTCVINI